MTACESSGYTGASFSITTTVLQIRHIIYTDFFSSSSSSLSLMWATFINNILFFLADVKIISSPRQQMLVLLFQRRVWPDPKKGPFSVLFSLSLSLSVTLICISPHIGKLLRASKEEAFSGSWMSLNITQYPGDIRGNPPVIFPVWRRYSPLSSLSAFCIPFESVW